MYIVGGKTVLLVFNTVLLSPIYFLMITLKILFKIKILQKCYEVLR